MRPGLSADDIYIMVEDEFHAVAQTFTKHLHHAEYVRLKNTAKNRNVSTINNISRPIDSITAMREETRKKKEAQARESKTKAALERIKPSVKRPVDESEESDFEEDRQDDPWQGTQLQRFMTTSPRKNLKGLTGLQGVTSHTRAAAGYERPEKKAGQATPTKVAPTKSAVAQVSEDSTSDSDDDDLDAPSRPPTRPPRLAPVSRRPPIPARKAADSPPPRIAKVRPRPPSPPPHKPPQRAFLDMTPRAAPIPTPIPAPTQRKPPRPDPVLPTKSKAPEPEEMRTSLLDGDAVRRRLKIRREKEERQRKRSRDEIGVDEIPVFLV